MNLFNIIRRKADPPVAPKPNFLVRKVKPVVIEGFNGSEIGDILDMPFDQGYRATYSGWVEPIEVEGHRLPPDIQCILDDKRTSEANRAAHEAEQLRELQRSRTVDVEFLTGAVSVKGIAVRRGLMAKLTPSEARIGHAAGWCMPSNPNFSVCL